MTDSGIGVDDLFGNAGLDDGSVGFDTTDPSGNFGGNSGISLSDVTPSFGGGIVNIPGLGNVNIAGTGTFQGSYPGAVGNTPVKATSPANTATHTPSLTVTDGGIQQNNTVLDKVLQGALSGLALLKGATQVPTTVSGSSSGLTAAQQQALLLSRSNVTGSNNLAGSFQTLIEQHPTEVAIGVVALALLLFKPPTLSRGR